MILKKKSILALLSFWTFFAFTLLSLVGLDSALASTVESVTNTYATLYPTQRKSFYANGRYWVFYSNGTNMYFENSTDGITWENKTSVRAATNGEHFSVWFEEATVKVHWAYCEQSVNKPIYYRSGTPESGGTITWDTADPLGEIAKPAEATYTYIHPNITVDSGGHALIGYRYMPGARGEVYVTKNNSTTGTWSPASGYPKQVSTIDRAASNIVIVPLTNERYLCIYSSAGNSLFMKAWDGSAFKGQLATTAAVASSASWNAVTETDSSDNVQIVWQVDGYTLKYVKYNYTPNSLTGETSIQTNPSSVFGPTVLARDASTNDLYTFYWRTDTNHIYYKKYTYLSSSWGGQVDWIDESSEGPTGTDRITSFYKSGSPIGVVYMTKSASPYNVKFGDLHPTAVRLESFRAYQKDEGVQLEWRTGYEVDNLGFHIYREEKGQLYRLTPELIAGSALLAGSGTALTAGKSYVWWDTSVGTQLSALSSQLSALKYWLEDVDLNGKRTMHGPVEIERLAGSDQQSAQKQGQPAFLSELGIRLEEKYREYWRIQELKEKLSQRPIKKFQPSTQSFEQASRASANQQEQVASAKLDQPSAQDIAMQWFLASRPAIKILVKEEGWYRVTQPELMASGLNPNSNPRYLQLYVDGKEQPIRVIGEKDGRFDPQDAIEFYGVGLDTLSTDTRVYWLVAGSRPGKRIQVFNGRGGLLSASSFPHAVEKKDRTIYFAALKNGDESNFFGPVIATEPVEHLLTVQHLAPSPPSDAILEVALRGVTFVPHQVQVLLNNVEVGEVSFTDQSRGLVRIPIPHSLLLEGENLVTLITQGGEMDVSLVDYIRLTYWHTYSADSDALKFTAQGGRQVSVAGFSSPNIRVIDITNPRALIEVTGAVTSQEEGYAITFRVPGESRRTLLTFTDERVKNPVGIIANQPSSWNQNMNGYDFVIISHKDFLGSLLPLKSLRESQGLSVVLIDVEDLYDEFNFGAKSPQALKDFLSRAKKHWRKAPRFILLVGDASFDPRNYLGLGDFDFVPTKLIDTFYLETASDDWFADMNKDAVPEIAVGRLPVRTAEEATTVVSKIIGYEQSVGMNEALLVADKNDGFNFEAASAEVGALLPSYITVREIFRSNFSSDALAKMEVLSSIDQGPLLVNYVGHGSVELWRGSLLTSDDADGLINGQRLPFFVNMSCLNGFFHDLYTESLSEALLKAPQGGAVAVWASSGLTYPDGQAVMNKKLIQLLFNGQSLTIGEAIMKAKASVTDKDIRKTWILFGDPTTRLK